VRADDEERCAEALESAIWIAPTTARVAWSRVLATHAFRPQDREEIERAIELLDDARGELDRRLGLRAPELAAVCAELHHRLGRDEAAREIVERAAELPADDRARSVLAATRARIEPAEDSGDDAAGEDEAKSAAANGR
jgi:hypothetical protein